MPSVLHIPLHRIDVLVVVPNTTASLFLLYWTCGSGKPRELQLVSHCDPSASFAPYFLYPMGDTTQMRYIGRSLQSCARVPVAFTACFSCLQTASQTVTVACSGCPFRLSRETCASTVLCARGTQDLLRALVKRIVATECFTRLV